MISGFAQPNLYVSCGLKKPDCWRGIGKGSGFEIRKRNINDSDGSSGSLLTSRLRHLSTLGIPKHLKLYLPILGSLLHGYLPYTIKMCKHAYAEPGVNSPWHSMPAVTLVICSTHEKDTSSYVGRKVLECPGGLVSDSLTYGAHRKSTRWFH